MPCFFFQQNKSFLSLPFPGLYDKEKSPAKWNRMFYMKINLKGTKSQKMPRYSKKRGNTSTYSRINHHKIIVIRSSIRHTTSDGKHLGDANELIEGFQKSKKYKHGTGTRYLQDELNFYTIIKRLKYQLKREEIAGFIFDLLCKARFISIQEILSTKMPISLKEAYFDYHYGIFNDNQQHLS